MKEEGLLLLSTDGLIVVNVQDNLSTLVIELLAILAFSHNLYFNNVQSLPFGEY